MTLDLRAPSDRMEALRRALGQRAHKEGCPAEAEAGGRIEGFEQKVIAPGRELPAGIEAGAFVTVIRCQECAGVRYIPSRLVDVLEAAAAS